MCWFSRLDGGVIVPSVSLLMVLQVSRYSVRYVGAGQHSNLHVYFQYFNAR